MLYAISVLKVIPFKNRQHFNAGRAAELFPFPKKIKENNDSRPPGKIVGRAAVFLFMRNMTAHGSLHLARKAEQVPQGLRNLGSSKRIFSLLFFENYQKNIDFLQEKIYYDDIKKISN